MIPDICFVVDLPSMTPTIITNVCCKTSYIPNSERLIGIDCTSYQPPKCTTIRFPNFPKVHSVAPSPRLTSLLQDIDSESASVLAKSQAAGLVIGRAGTPSQQEMTWYAESQWTATVADGCWVPSLEPNGCVCWAAALQPANVSHGAIAFLDNLHDFRGSSIGQESRPKPCASRPLHLCRCWKLGCQRAQVIAAYKCGAAWPRAVC